MDDIIQEGNYVIDTDIRLVKVIKILSNNVTIEGNSNTLKQISNTKNLFAFEIGEGVENVVINNIIFQNLSGGAVRALGNNSGIIIKNIKTINCGYLADNNLKGFNSLLLFDGSQKKIKNVKIIDSTFAETGILDQNIANMASSILVYGGVDITIKGCTIDGCVGEIISWGIVGIDITNLLIEDIFITDVFSSKNARSIFTYDLDGQINDKQEASIISNVPANKFREFLDNHIDVNYDVENKDSKEIEASHLKNVVPKYLENEELLFQEHKWREFRTLGRLVCHQSHKKSKTSGVYLKWVELFCDRVLGVKVKVVSGFANLYLNGNVCLPSHRDAYKKWIFGLSFGDTRTLDFISDLNSEVISYEMEAGDVVLFSHDVNNRYQHRMLAEPDKTNRRINLTYFLEVLEGDGDRLLSKEIDYNLIPTFEECM